MYKKYRVYVATVRGSYEMGAADSVNGLAAIVAQWLDGTSVGRSVMDLYDRDPKTGKQVFSHSDVREVMLYTLDEATGAYQFSKKAPVARRTDIIKAIRSLGAR